LCRGPAQLWKSNWDVLGCKRGTFTSNAPCIGLCPRSSSNTSTPYFPSYPTKVPLIDDVLQNFIEERRKFLLRYNLEPDTRPEIVCPVDDEKLRQLLEIRQLFPSCFSDFTGRVVTEEALPILPPLYRCVVSIGRELVEQSSTLPFPRSQSQPMFTLELLPSAARYQAQHGFQGVSYLPCST